MILFIFLVSETDFSSQIKSQFRCKQEDKNSKLAEARNATARDISSCKPNPLYKNEWETNTEAPSPF